MISVNTNKKIVLNVEMNETDIDRRLIHNFVGKTFKLTSVSSSKGKPYKLEFIETEAILVKVIND